MVSFDNRHESMSAFVLLVLTLIYIVHIVANELQRCLMMLTEKLTLFLSRRNEQVRICFIFET